MRTRWACFAIGMSLILAPLALGYEQVMAILHDVALGVVTCVLALAAMERARLRFALVAPALWLLWTPQLLEFGGMTSGTEIAAGATLVLLVALPASQMAQTERPAKIAA